MVGGCLGPIVVGVIMAGIALSAVLQKQATAPEGAIAVAPTSTTPVVAPAAQISLGVATPGAKSDRLFVLTLPDNTVAEQKVPVDWRVASLEPARLKIETSSKGDGSFILDGAPEWNVPLRARSGKPYEDVTFLGMFDASHAALIARGEDEAVLSVSRVGDIREVARLPGDRTVLRVAEGAVWVSTFQQGEGIESPPSGPSSLLKMAFDGVSSTAATDPHVIVSVTPGPNGAFAYGLDSGDAVASSGATHWSGQGRALVWLDEHRLLLAKGVTISVLDLSEGTLSRIVDIPAAPSFGVLTTSTEPL